MIVFRGYFGFLPVLFGVGWSLADSDLIWPSSNEGNKFGGSSPGALDVEY